MGPVGLDDQGLHRVKAFLAGRAEVQAGAGHGQVKGLERERAHDAVEGGGASRQVGADHPALAVGQGPGRVSRRICR